MQDPPPPGTISCLAEFLGETADSWHNPGLDGIANLEVLTGHPRTVRGNLESPSPFQDQGLIMRDFWMLYSAEAVV
ncbi:MAG: hypothetical protein AUI97_07450 [Crenarchaeota archaeon 13_1_40CM_3_52_17]|nr:MAG: hypothetical protein AUI97_07450 [Crenarchaeota archaeon 13_1_40CM_3_52_17]